ncbi:flagellar hook-associated protein FlgK [Candidatus Clostridium stratigraminis]|uniref:Flagellar hook-associated protein 1 n=1 Tax=Candidatus Clostridium stratigraminis TaxID=3381661 RepID=A0ABW8T4E3_9CLOT
MSGLFSTLYIGTRGMAVQQGAIDVTSHNIANANTDGYSRQRAIIETTRPFSMPSVNNAAAPGQLGTGAQIQAIQRIRDSFLDYQVRVETSTQGQYTARDKFLSEIETIFNEPSDTGISSLMGKFFQSWQNLSTDAASSNSRTIVIQQASALADELNHTATQLQKLKDNAQTTIKDTVFEVNDILNQIDKLNQQIISVKVAGQMPNDLMDRRDLLLDQLSSKFNINIDKKNFEGQDVSPVNSIAPTNSNLIQAINPEQERRLSYVDSITKNTDASGNITYDIKYYKFGDKSTEANAVTITGVTLSPDEFKALDENRVIWADNSGIAIDSNGNQIKAVDSAGNSIGTGSYSNATLFTPSDGELKGYSSVQADIDGYMDQLDSIAKALAFSVNAVLSGVTDGSGIRTNADGSTVNIQTKDYMPLFVNSDTAKYTQSNSKNILYDPSDTTNLDNALAGEKDITAANISVSKQLIDNVMQLKTRLNDDMFATEGENNLDGVNDGYRALAVAQLKDKLILIQSINTNTTRADIFDSTKGGNSITVNGNAIDFVSSSGGIKIEDYFKDMVDGLGVQEAQAQRIVKNQGTLLADFQQRRDSVSGVSIDEEMANLIQYQHAYQANAKIIATCDELLDVVVNGLKK